MTFDFDKLVELRNTHSSKWDNMAERCRLDAPDAIPMWVADMDFEAPPPVVAALRGELERGVFGYYDSNRTWREAASEWSERRHGWQPDPDWFSPTPGIIAALGMILQEFSDAGDEIIVFSPVYHAFRYIIEANDRVIVNVPMPEEQGRYRMDVDRLADMITPRGKIVILCSPHNPCGRVWSREELRTVAQFCIDRDLILVSDEIHQDLVYPGARHIPTALAAPEVMDRLFTLTAVTKTFNLAGAHVGTAITSNPELRKRLDARLKAAGMFSIGRFGMVATEAAMREGDAWLDALIPYLEANRDHFAAGIARAVPGARAMHLEATYLGWVDFSGTGLEPGDVLDRITNKARIGVSPGPQFGPGGEHHQRMNFAMPRARLDEALGRLQEAFSDLG